MARGGWGQVVRLGVGAEGRSTSSDQGGDEEATALVAVMRVTRVGVVQRSRGRPERPRARVLMCATGQGFGRMASRGARPSPFGHKIPGPRASAAVVAGRGRAGPLLHGGGKEPGSVGTLSTALCAGLGEAARLAVERASGRGARPRLATGTGDRQRWNVNAASSQHPGNLNLRRERLTTPGWIAICAISLSGRVGLRERLGAPSHVLRALGLTTSRRARRFGWDSPTPARRSWPRPAVGSTKQRGRRRTSPRDPPRDPRAGSQGRRDA